MEDSTTGIVTAIKMNSDIRESTYTVITDSDIRQIKSGIMLDLFDTVDLTTGEAIIKEKASI